MKIYDDGGKFVDDRRKGIEGCVAVAAVRVAADEAAGGVVGTAWLAAAGCFHLAA